jgi:hypothetical protein
VSLVRLFRALQVALLVVASANGAGGAGRAAPQAGAGEPAEWSLEEIKDKRRVFLMASRGRVLDVRGPDPAEMLDALAGGELRPHRYPFGVIARKFNAYVRKRGGMSAAARVAEADYVVYFNVLEYRRVLGAVYPYGELFVILNRGADGSAPRIIWKTRKPAWAEDAAEEFLKELRRVRGEK